MFAVTGTFLSTLITGGLLIAVSSMGLMDTNFEVWEAFTFSALISAIDPVAVLAVFEQTRTNHNLGVLIEGESILNDAVSIILYTTFFTLQEEDRTLSVGFLFQTIGTFLYFVLGGFAVGLAIAMLNTFIARFTEKVYILEWAFVILFAYASYVVSELATLSNIIGILTFSVFVAKYMQWNIRHYSHISVQLTTKAIASTAESYIFILLGIVTVTREDELVWDWLLNLWLLVIIVVTRIIVVMGLSFLVNQRRKVKIDIKSQFILVWGSLRGAIAFALAESLPISDFPNQPVIVSSTIWIVFITVFGFGTSLPLMLKIFKIKSSQSHNAVSDVLSRMFDISTNAIQAITGEPRSWWRTSWLWLEKYFINRWLVNKRRIDEDLDVVLQKEMEERLSQLYAQEEEQDDEQQSRITRVFDEYRQRTPTNFIDVNQRDAFILEQMRTPHAHTEQVTRLIDVVGAEHASQHPGSTLSLFSPAHQVVLPPSDVEEQPEHTIVRVGSPFTMERSVTSEAFESFGAYVDRRTFITRIDVGYEHYATGHQHNRDLNTLTARTMNIGVQDVRYGLGLRDIETLDHTREVYFVTDDDFL
ncbi:hypothetical protein PCE1_002427 [Barthelona sp. PCE]